MDTVVIYPGRFHPFHKGHKSVYDALVKRFGKNRVYIATSNKVDPPKSPFTFDEKRAMMALTGVDPSRVVQVKNPYQATEITDNFDPQNTIALFAVSDKDMAEDPRFSFKPRKDGQPSYYQPASKDMQGFDKHGYIITVPTLQFNVLGEPMRSATEFRANFARADNEKQKSMITDLFGQYDPKTHNTMAQKIVEQLIRADEILDKLIEMGADDCYILEACIRVDTLVENINMKQRKQTLYQAIMEGGHTLPVNEAELACPVAAGDLAVNTENRDRTIKQFNYGPLNVDIPGDYWEKIADYWDTTEQAAKASNCGNCVAFDISERMKDCLPGDTFDDDGELGYCWMHHFKCHSARSCHTWAKGGPIKTEKESAEWQGKAFGVKEEITDFNTEDPMNSVIAIRGIGTMSISSALEKVSEMAMDIAKLGAMKDAKNVQDNLPRYMDLLATYNESIQEAYRELAQQRKRGGTASRGIDKDISEVMDQDRLNKFLGKKDDDDEDYKKDLTPITISGGKKKPGYRPIIDLDDLDGFNEHCGDPMAHDHAPGRTLLMKLYKKEMQCKPGSPEHFEVMKMIDGCRKNIGLEEGMWDTVTKTVGKAAQAVGKTVQGAVDQRTATLTGGKKKSTSSFRPS
jgi:cytidyltransferase-like protein